MKTKELKEKIGYLKELRPKVLPNIFQNVRVQQKDGYIVFSGTDLERYLILKIKNCAPDTEPILVNRKTLIETVKKIKDKEVQVKITNGSISLKNENFTLTISKEDTKAEDYPAFKYNTKIVHNLKVNHKEFIDTINETIPFLSDDDNREILKNIYIDQNKIIGTDAYKVSVTFVETKYLNNPILLSPESAKSIVKIFLNSETLSITKEDKGFLSFIDGFRDIELRVVVEDVKNEDEDKNTNKQYPIKGVDRILEEKTLGSFKAKGLLQALEAVPDFSNQKGNSLKMEIDNPDLNKMLITVENTGFNQQILLPVDNQGNIQHKNRYSQQLLITCLKGLENPLIEYQGLERSINLKENNKIRVLMPMRWDLKGARV